MLNDKAKAELEQQVAFVRSQLMTLDEMLKKIPHSENWRDTIEVFLNESLFLVDDLDRK